MIDHPCILLVENYYATRIAERDFLESKGYITYCCTTGKEVMDAVEGGLAYELAIVDRSLPDVADNSLVRRLKDIHPDIPVILVTAAERFVERSADVTLYRIFTPQTLLETVERLLRERERSRS